MLVYYSNCINDRVWIIPILVFTLTVSMTESGSFLFLFITLTVSMTEFGSFPCLFITLTVSVTEFGSFPC